MPGDPQVIEIRLNSPAEMFELAPTELFSEFRNYLTGVEMCLSELRSRMSRRPVKVMITLPESEIDDDTGSVIGRTLRGFCDQRISYNRREKRALHVDGISALRVGLPIALIGLAMTAIAAGMGESANSTLTSVTDHLGWVLAWLGLWFPLDVFFFYPLQYQRETQSLRRLRVAEVEVRPGRPVVPNW